MGVNIEKDPLVGTVPDKWLNDKSLHSTLQENKMLSTS